MRKRILNFIGVLLMILYPFLVWVALDRHLSVRWLSLLLACAIFFHFLHHRHLLFLCVGIALCGALLISAQAVFLKIYPVIMNALVCGIFALSLRQKPLITLFAERMGHSLNADGLAYTKRVTIVWAIFMAFQTIISGITVFLSDKIWVLYNGLISYLCIGLLMAGEYAFRQWRQHA